MKLTRGRANTLIVLIALALQVSAAQAADNSRSRLLGYFGMGQSSATSADGKGSASEGPFGYGVSLDYAWKPSQYIFGEHMRSYGDGSSSIGITAMGIKYYPWLSPSDARGSWAGLAGRSLIASQGYAYFIGSSFGLAQASMLPVGKSNAVVAVGPVFSVKAGSDYDLNRDLSLRTEFSMHMSAGGSGSVSLMILSMGIGYAL